MESEETVTFFNVTLRYSNGGSPDFWTVSVASELVAPSTAFVISCGVALSTYLDRKSVV